MAIATWQCSASGRYWLDVLVGSLQVSLMIDTGLVDPEQRVGIELEPHLFDQLEQNGKLSGRALRIRKDAGGIHRRCIVLRWMRVWRLLRQTNHWGHQSAFTSHAESRVFPAAWVWHSSTNFQVAEWSGTAPRKLGRFQRPELDRSLCDLSVVMLKRTENGPQAS